MKPVANNGYDAICLYDENQAFAKSKTQFI